MEPMKACTAVHAGPFSNVLPVHVYPCAERSSCAIRSWAALRSARRALICSSFLNLLARRLRTSASFSCRRAWRYSSSLRSSLISTRASARSRFASARSVSKRPMRSNSSSNLPRTESPTFSDIECVLLSDFAGQKTLG